MNENVVGGEGSAVYKVDDCADDEEADPQRCCWYRLSSRLLRALIYAATAAAFTMCALLRGDFSLLCTRPDAERCCLVVRLKRVCGSYGGLERWHFEVE